MALRNARELTRRASVTDRDFARAFWRGTAPKNQSAGATSARGVWTVVALISAVGAASFSSALAIASRLAQTSDSAQGFVEGYAIAHGNVLLSGWLLPLDNYYFTDTIPYAVLEWILGPRPVLFVLVPAFAYALFVCAGLALCVNRAQSLARSVEAAAAAALMLAPSGWIGSWNPLLMSDMHFAAVVLAVIALALLARMARSEQRGSVLAMWCTLSIVITSATIASDPFSLVFAFGPALAVLAADELLHGSKQNKRIALLALTSAIFVGPLLPILISHVGGFASEHNVVEALVSPGLLARNTSALLGGILKLSGANPIGATLTFGTVAFLALRGIVLAIAVGAVVLSTRSMFARERPPLLDRFLCAGVLSVLAACMLSLQFGKGIDANNPWVGGPPMRYAMPAVMFAAILGARRIPEMLSALRAERARSLARGVLVGFGTLALCAAPLEAANVEPHWISSNPPATVARWLETHGLISGDADYWSANLIAAMSGEVLHLRSVVPGDGEVVPYRLSADTRRPSEPAQFMIWQDGTRSGMTFADVRATYSICRLVTVAGYRIALLARPVGPGSCTGVADEDGAQLRRDQDPR